MYLIGQLEHYLLYTANWDNSRSRPTAKLKLCDNDLWISLRASPHSRRYCNCPIDNYSERSLALLIPGSRLNARNSPSASPYCNRQPLKFRGSNEPWKFLDVYTEIFLVGTFLYISQVGQVYIRKHENLMQQAFSELAFCKHCILIKISTHNTWRLLLCVSELHITGIWR